MEIVVGAVSVVIIILMAILVIVDVKDIRQKEETIQRLRKAELEKEKILYESIIRELDNLLVETRQTKKMKETYAKKLAEIDERIWH